jgi:hypothetical protein
MNYMRRPRSHRFGIVDYIILAVIVLVGLLLMWPWWAYLLGVLCVVILIFNKTLRIQIINAFTRDDEVDSATISLRHWMLVALGVAGALAAQVCLIAAGMHDLQWWLVPMGCLIPAIRLYAMGSRSRSWPRLQRALCDNLFELALIAFLVLAGFTVALGHFRALPLDNMTLHDLQELQKEIGEKHEWLETHRLGFFSLLAFLIAIILLRIAAKMNPRIEGRVSITSKVLVGSVKWWERATCAAAFTASFTFLATGAGGQLYEPVSLTLKDAQTNYDTFRAKINEHVDFVLRRELVTEALKNASPKLRMEMTQAKDFYALREQVGWERTIAASNFKIKTDEPEHFPQRGSLPREAAKPDIPVATPRDAPLSSTPARLRQSEKTAEQVVSDDNSGRLEHHLDRERTKEKDDSAEEMAKETIEGLPIADLIFAKATILESLKAHYPVLGELADAISSSVSEASFDAVRDSIARKLEDQCVDSCGSISQATLNEVHIAQLQAPRLGDRFNAKWARDTQTILDSYNAEINAEERTLREAAAQVNAKRIDYAFRDASDNVDIIERVAIETKSSDLQKEVATLRETLIQLKKAGGEFPLLTAASPEQRQILDEIKAHVGKRSVYIYLDNDAWTTPLDGIVKCSRAGEMELGRLVGKSVLLPEEEARLRDAIGVKFDSFRKRAIEEHLGEIPHPVRTNTSGGVEDDVHVEHPVEVP